MPHLEPDSNVPVQLDATYRTMFAMIPGWWRVVLEGPEA